MLVVEVVPTVATTQNGRHPLARSSSIAWASELGFIRNSESVPILRTPSCPIPRVMTALSIEECACSEQYNRNRVFEALSPFSRIGSSLTASRAAAIAQRLDIEAVS